MNYCVYLPEITEESQNETQPADFETTLKDVINRIALPTVCVFGVVGNILNLTILTRRKLQKSFRSLEQAANLCLIALAVSDLMFCVLAFFYTFLPPNNVYEDKGIRYFYGMYSTALINLFIMESTMLTVAMSLERYMAICFPLRQDLYLTTRRIKYIIVGSFLFSLAFNVPVLWRFEAVPICSNATASTNMTVGYVNDSVTSVSDRMEPAHHEADSSFSSINAVSTFLSTLSPRESLPRPLSLASSSSSSFASASSSSSSSLPSNSFSNSNPVTGTLSRSSKPMSPSLSLPSSSPSPPMSSSSSPLSSLLHSSQPKRFQRIMIPLWGSQVYELAYRVCWALVGNFIPLVLLFFFNVCLCRNIYLSYKLRRQFKRQNQAKSSSHILTVTLVVIVVMFFILVAPSEIVLLSGMSGSVEIIFNFLQSLNFSVNFILYCIISRHFRKTLKYLCLCGCYNIYQVSRDWKKEFETSLM